MKTKFIVFNVANLTGDGKALPVRSKLIKLERPVDEVINDIRRYYPFITEKEITGYGGEYISITKMLPCDEPFWAVANDAIEAVEYFAKRKKSFLARLFKRGK